MYLSEEQVSACCLGPDKPLFEPLQFSALTCNNNNKTGDKRALCQEEEEEEEEETDVFLFFNKIN